MKEKISSELDSQKLKQSQQSLVFLIWCIVAIVEGIVAILLLLNIPSDPNNTWVLGLSKSRLVLLVGILVTLLTLGFLVFLVWQKPETVWLFLRRIHVKIRNKLIYTFLVIFSLLGAIFFSQLSHLGWVVSDLYVRGYLLRLLPVMIWGAGLCIQTLLTLPLFLYDTRRTGRILQPVLIRNSTLVFMGMSILSLGIVITGFGIEPDKVGWDAPGVPVLPIQVGFVWVLGLLFLLLDSWFKRVDKPLKANYILEILIGILVWGTAFITWSQEPLKPNYFSPQPRAPNYEFYPFSDAALHDLVAQNLMIGEGFPGVARKPLYGLFLAFSHMIAGQNYQEVILVQVAVLALFPVFVYRLGSSLHHRISGFIAAGMIILRERNAIAIADKIGVSHAKLMMSDLPATLAIVMVTWMVVLWIQSPMRRRVLPLGIGGGVGLLMLLRPQFILLIPALIFLVVIVFFKQALRGVESLSLIALGITLTIGPWLWRSYQITGRFTLNDPNQQAFLTQQYRLEPGSDILSKLPEESEAEFIQRVNDEVKTFVLEHPVEVAGFVAAHFFHNQIEMIQALPMSFWIVANPDSDLYPYWVEKWNKLWNDCCSVGAYVDSIGFWDPIRENIQTTQIFPIALNILLLSIGLGTMWTRQNLIGWIPLLISLVYSMSTAVGRYSGWRLILPADWVVFLYLSIGIGQLTLWIQAYFSGQSGGYFSQSNKGIIWKSKNTLRDYAIFPLGSSITLGVILLGMGFVPIIIEVAVPQRYASSTNLELLFPEPNFPDDEILSFLEDENSVIVQGRGLYPRYYKSGDGEPGESWPAFNSRDFSRLGFMVVGPQKYSVIIPMEQPPDYFPNASDVIVAGCKGDSYIDAGFVAILTNPQRILVRPSLDKFTCPSPLPK